MSTITYTIPAGHHSGGPYKPRLLRNVTAMSFSVKFNKNCRYTLDKGDHEDINKLPGFSCSMLSHHHRDSLRPGWNYHEGYDEIDLFAYYYRSGKRDHDYVASAKLEQWVDITMERLWGRQWIMLVRTPDDSGSVQLTLHKSPDFGWMLHTFFGGNRPTPHSMDIEIKNLSITQSDMKILPPAKLGTVWQFIIGLVLPGAMAVATYDYLTEGTSAGYGFAAVLFLALVAYIYLLVSAWRQEA